MKDTQIPAAIDDDEIDAFFNACASLEDSVVASAPDKSYESPPKKRLRYDSSYSGSSDDEGSVRDQHDYDAFLRKQVKEVLNYYNSNHKDADYECVTIVAQCPYKGKGRWAVGTHMNFFARQKGSDSSPELFYADHIVCDSQKEIECCILNPSPISFDEFVPEGGPSISVYHRPNVKCVDCETVAKAMAMQELEGDDDNDDDDYSCMYILYQGVSIIYILLCETVVFRVLVCHFQISLTCEMPQKLLFLPMQRLTNCFVKYILATNGT